MLFLEAVVGLKAMALGLLAATLTLGLSAGMHVHDILPARTQAPLHRVSPHYISFALDSAFLRDPTGIDTGVPLPPDATNSTRIDFQDAPPNTVMPLVAGGYIRIGGTYTDFVHYYVPGTNYTQCPYKHVSRKYCHSYPCCLPLTMARWKEALVWAHRNNIRLLYNLNLLHGRYANYSTHLREPEWWEGCTHLQCPDKPAWDSSNARALMQWTAANVQPEMWPAAFGLGNELQYYLPAAQWAQDSVTMYELVREIFTPASSHPDQAPGTYGPCNSGLVAEWSTNYLDNVTALNPQALDASTFHGYQHAPADVESVASMDSTEVDASRAYFASVAAMHAQANTTSKVWITETAWSATPPQGAVNGSGATAAVNGMSRASDLAWNLGALGAAAEVGVGVFCRETLAGDWLEVIGLWQPGGACTGDNSRAYTPHPDFWVAALWAKLMGLAVLGANVNTSQTLSEPHHAPAAAPVVGQAALSSSGPTLTNEPPPTLRTFAHCSRRIPGAVAFAVAVSPCARTEALVLRFAGARTLTTYMLMSAGGVGHDALDLNGEKLNVSIGHAPTLQGKTVQGDTVVVPAVGACAVGFVEAEYTQTVAACM